MHFTKEKKQRKKNNSYICKFTHSPNHTFYK